MKKKVFCGILALLLILTSFACIKSNPVESTATPESSLPSASESTAFLAASQEPATEAQKPAVETPEPLPADPAEGLTPFADDYQDRLPENAEDGLTLHAFNWTYHEILINLENIRNAGFKNVLTMPIQQPKGGGNTWWAFYQPLSFSIGDNSALGSKEELVTLCAEAEKYGICILADIVVNHMANIDDDAVEADGTPTVLPAVATYEPILYNNRNEDVDGVGVTFHHNRNASGSGAETQVYAYGNLPDLNTENAYVQERVLALLCECIDAGVDGFRFDAAKHIETEQDPDYPSEFWNNTLEKAKDYYREKTGKELYAYGEILNSPTGRDLSVYTDHMRITDDGFTAQFKSAFANKDANRILEADVKGGDATKLIAWVESHDEYVTSNTHYTNVRVAKYWAVIAAKKGLGGLYLARPTDDLAVGQVGSYAFESEYVAISNRFHNRFTAAESYESVDGSCYIVEKILPDDQGVMILNVGDVNTEEAVPVAVPHLDDGIYYDSLTGHAVPVRDRVAYVQFEANGLAVVTRSMGVYPQLTVSERDCSFIGEKTVSLKTKNCEEAYWYCNGDESARADFTESADVQVSDFVQDGKVDLTVVIRNGKNVLEQTFTYTQLQLLDGGFNLVNLDPKYLNGEYELYIWSWSPGKWSKDYEVRDGIVIVDTTGLTGFLIAAFEKGYEVTDVNNWDPNVLKQSGDVKGELLQQGFMDMTGF
ncbi:MAG: hypothetical protein IJP98_04830 [Clostridia bacterium]|nr:hypothetical protein [Clostridia bacterium]